MTTELEQFERAAQRQIDEFFAPEKKRYRRKASPSPRVRGYTVELAVRKKQFSLLDERYVYHSNSISRLQAKTEAEQAARKDGWPVVGYVVEITMRE